ncbi:hypothetical protein CVN56_25705 [Rhodococcus sp. AQ5-07]|uniref:NAD(P)H-binding protein n=1 Tax=Rhodococcus sp. AQ5-07 TaxID=2054902 RepID=UPI000DBFB05F|nr:NAD(P)H-binding protein [Rhodococcus sp. AQ5-07]RAL31584.1 hypothetical protein CVN56_25705 [Rhodococcus sp. AQ5-07]
MRNFLVTGATGNLGGAALRILQTQTGSNTSALVRNTTQADALARESIKTRVGDYTDRASLRTAFRGIDSLLFVSSPALDTNVRIAQHKAVVQEAVSAGVGHIVYTSAMGAQHDPGHHSTETELHEIGVNHTVLRNALYTDAFAAKAIRDAESGTVLSASEGSTVVTSSIADLAEAAVIALTTPPAKQLWELRGPAWTFDQLAEAVSAELGRKIRHSEVDDLDTGPFAVLFPLIRKGVFSEESDDLATLLRRAPQHIEAVVAQLCRS